MSTITTTAPSFEAPRTSGRRILVAGAVVAGLVVAGAVAVPRLTAQTASPTYPAVTPHDAVEHQLDTERAAAAGSAQRLQSERVQRRMDLGAKQIAAVASARQVRAFQPALQPGTTRAYVGGQLQTVEIPRVVERSVVQEQTGQIGHYTWTPPLTTQRYVGSTLETVPVTAGTTGTLQSSTAGQQIGGRHESYAYTPSGSGLHLTWTDPWVPPYDNPDWVPAIKAHYFHPVSTRVTPPHEYR